MLHFKLKPRSNSNRIIGRRRRGSSGDVAHYKINLSFLFRLNILFVPIIRTVAKVAGNHFCLTFV